MWKKNQETENEYNSVEKAENMKKMRKKSLGKKWDKI